MGNISCTHRVRGGLFRDGHYHKQVTVGKRRVKEGECAAIWNRKGEVRNVVGPKLVRVFFSDVRFLDRFVADQNQYLVVCFRDGRKENVRGPSALFLDPVAHKSVEVKEAISLNASECLVVYRETDNRRDGGILAPAEESKEQDGDAAAAASASSVKITVAKTLGHENGVTRRIIRGPTMFIPQANEWIHEFSWHGSNNRMDDARTMIKDALKLTKIRTLPDQLYYNVTSCRTSDDAQLNIKLMVFYQLQSVETMLDQTHDPIGDIVNAVSADVIRFAAEMSFEVFVKRSHELNELAAFPMLVERAGTIGSKINKVVFRGYKASEQLQAMHDSAIKTRTKLNLEARTAEQQQQIEDLKLQAKQGRATKEREMEAANQAHQRELKALAHAESLRMSDAEAAAAQARKQAADAQKVEFLKELAGQGVDLTAYLVAQERKSERVISFETGHSSSLSSATGGGGGGGSGLVTPHVHLN